MVNAVSAILFPLVSNNGFTSVTSKQTTFPVSIKLLREQDIVIVVASDVPRELFDNPLYEATNKVRFWNIDDVKNLFTPSDENNKEIIEKIIKKVDELNKELTE